MLQWRNKCPYEFGPRKSFSILSLCKYSWIVFSSNLPAWLYMCCQIFSMSEIFIHLSITVQNPHLPFLQTSSMCLDLGLGSTNCVYFLFIEHLLCARPFARSQVPKMNKADGPCNQGAHSLERKTNNKQRNKNHQNKRPGTIGWRSGPWKKSFSCGWDQGSPLWARKGDLWAGHEEREVSSMKSWESTTRAEGTAWERYRGTEAGLLPFWSLFSLRHAGHWPPLSHDICCFPGPSLCHIG